MKEAPKPPSPPKTSPKVYLTPQLAKRKDGMCPSLLHQEVKKDKPGYLSKPYRTNSSLLLQVKEHSGIHRDIVELQTLADSVNKVLKVFVKSGRGLVSLSFKSEGCTWKLALDPETAGGKTYRMEVVCQANSGGAKITNYVIKSTIIPKIPVDPNPLAPPPKGFKEAKGVFDSVVLKVRKSLVRLEFPEFPEGCKGKAFREVYQLNARLKSGSFATVCRGTHRATGRKVAIKCVLRKDLPASDDAAIYDEVAILASLNHPHIVPIVDFFDEQDCYFIVMELMSGGDLFDRIGKKKTYNEADARDLIVKMLKAVAFCHRRRIAHCDMKPKNLLLMSDDNDSFIKLADFGFAARVHRPKSLTKQCGTPFFVAPEILTRKPYDQQSDMWSVGCIVFLLLSGNLPFLGRSQKELFRKIVAGKFEFKESDWQGVSEDAKDLVRKLLVLNPDDRITAEQALRHPYLKLSKDRLSKIGLQSTSQRLKTFNAKMKLRSAMIAVDWISSLKQVSWMSSRNLNTKSGSAKLNNASNPLYARARRVQKLREEDSRGSGSHGKKKSKMEF